METKQVSESWAAYTRGTHRIGRICTVITLLLLVGAPFLMGAYLGALPDLGAVAKAFLSVGLVTGNLINMKIPCAVNARDIVGAKTGTPENEIISTLSIATSSLVTILVLALGVLLLTPLKPILQSEALQPAFSNVVPALFGAMAYKYYRNHMNVAVAPLMLMSVLFVLVPSLIASTSMMIIPSGALAIGIAWLLYGKQRKGA